MKKLIILSILTFLIFQTSFSQEYGWTDISANIPGNPNLSDVFFVSDIEGWITSSSQAEIYHTSDGGQTFNIQSTQTSLEAIYMINQSEGYTGGGSGFVYKTSNGGTNWVFFGSIASTLTDIDYATNIQGYACGDGGAVFSITPQGVTNLNSGQPTFFSGISSTSLDNVWICGGNDIMYYNGSTFAFQSGPAGSYNDIFFLNNQKGWVVGDNGLIGYTENGGTTWAPQSSPTTTMALYNVFFFDADNGRAVGFNGTILKTTNGGDTWVLDEEGSTLAGTKFLRGVHFTSSTNGYVVGNGKTLLKYGEITSIVEENRALKFDIYPNPTKDKLQIVSADFITENGTIVILSIDGRKILKREIGQGNRNVEIDVSHLETGIYLCKIIIDNKSSIKKMIKE
jgi:photosystem II stability/assembly factor-like uncharacterized protein